jgi:hypothetical protein
VVQVTSICDGQLPAQYDVIALTWQFGNAAPSGLLSRSAVAQHAPPSVASVPGQSDEPRHWTVLSAAHVP